MKQTSFYIVAIATMAMALLSCGKPPPGTSFNQGSGNGPVMVVQLAGRTFTLVETKNSFGQAFAVPPKSLTITFNSNTDVTGTFVCFPETEMTPSFVATAQWNQSSIMFTGINSTTPNCLPNHYVNLASSLSYQFPTNPAGMILTDFSGNQAIFSQQ